MRPFYRHQPRLLTLIVLHE